MESPLVFIALGSNTWSEWELLFAHRQPLLLYQSFFSSSPCSPRIPPSSALFPLLTVGNHLHPCVENFLRAENVGAELCGGTAPPAVTRGTTGALQPKDIRILRKMKYLIFYRLFGPVMVNISVQYWGNIQFYILGYKLLEDKKFHS